jgi:hypothetical protein
MRAQDVQGFGYRVDGNRMATGLADGVDEQGQGGEVVKVGMGEENVVDTLKLAEAKIAYSGTAIEKNIVIQQKSGSTRFRVTDPSITPQHR